ncbi:hypothetical protein HK097_009319 [Rhizophlyctis rosea]|uniref:Uncharacterized protein n=1 Tax=Rhizophlyctis rosea TaxID=64517 RepID=A0AAD5S942_9FUNG|nr:hypothetical protein HK097_009319 [Rhizophlyctis rosea]
MQTPAEPTFNADLNILNESLNSMSVDDMDVQADGPSIEPPQPEGDDVTARIMAELEARAKAEAPALKAAGLLDTSMRNGNSLHDNSHGNGKFDAVHQKEFRRMQSISEHFAAKRASNLNLKEKAALGDKRRTVEVPSSQPAKRMKVDERTAKPVIAPVPKVKVTPKVVGGGGRSTTTTMNAPATGSTRTPLNYRRPTTAKTPATKPAPTFGSQTVDVRTSRVPSTSTPSTSGTFTFGSARTSTQTKGQDFHGGTKKPVFDLKKSLEKPLSWIPKKGPLRDTGTPAFGSR